jgi:hypothetical protein
MERVAGHPIESLYCRSISKKVEGFFERKAERGGWTAGSIVPEFEGSFVKRPVIARSGPSARPIGRSRKVGDVATLVGPFLVPKS